MEKYEEGEKGGGEIGIEGGWSDLNFGIPTDPLLLLNLSLASSPPAVRSSEKEAGNEWVKEKEPGLEFAEVSKLPLEEPIVF